MNVQTYPDAAAFLAVAGSSLSENEAANSLMLGICERLRTHPGWLRQPPFLATVSGPPGLLLAAMMTPPQNIVLAPLDAGAGAALPLLIAALRDGGWSVPGVLAPREIARSFAAAWVAAAGGDYRLRMAQRVHELRTVQLPEGSVPGVLRVATSADFDLVYSWARAFFQEALGEEDPDQIRLLVEQRLAPGDMVLWEDGVPVSMAMRTRPAGSGISVSAVYTPPGQRRKGYATACVAALSRQLLASGYDYCALFTDLANPTSNDIYRQIGYRPVADFDEYRFTA
jgi:uncharacterized protein